MLKADTKPPWHPWDVRKGPFHTCVTIEKSMGLFPLLSFKIFLRQLNGKPCLSNVSYFYFFMNSSAISPPFFSERKGISQHFSLIMQC